MNDIKLLKERQREKHPGFPTYLECMTRTLFTGLSGFTLSFASVYFSQKLLQHKIPYDKKYNILISAVFASVIAFKITKDRTLSCQKAWLASEDKLTDS